MRISTIPHIYRNVRRWTEMLSVLSKYGLADWLSRLNIEMFKTQLKGSQGEALALQTPERRIRLALTELGPTYIKLGQLLSTRPDFVGRLRWPRSSNSCGTMCRPTDPATVRRTIEIELGQSAEELFAEFEDVPVASASIGQVHRARLKTGERVAVKIQHAGIEKVVREDLDVLAGLALLAERIPEFAPYRPRETVAEIARMLRRELDFGREERNLQQFALLFENDTTIRIPQPFTELCTSRVLTMEWIDGLKIAERDQLIGAGFDLNEIARRGAQLYLQMIFTHGYYHADPHPGNIAILPGNVIALLDFGMVGRDSGTPARRHRRDAAGHRAERRVAADLADQTRGSGPARSGRRRAGHRRGRLRGYVFHAVARPIRSGRRTERHDGDRAPLSHRLARPGRHVDQGPGHARRHHADAQSAIQPDGGHAAVPSPHAARTAVADAPVAEVPPPAAGTRTADRSPARAG